MSILPQPNLTTATRCSARKLAGVRATGQEWKSKVRTIPITDERSARLGNADTDLYDHQTKWPGF
jgi:hypothetical protein